jgi:uncharacterized protein YndB with AHSA1/START domain
MSNARPNAATAIADLDKGVVLARVDIAVPPARVFTALTTSELTEWWGSPEMYRTTKHTMDLRVGGAWRTEGVGNDGVPFHVEGEVLAIEPPNHLAYTWKTSWDGGEVTTVDYRFEPTPTGTRVTVRHTGFKDPKSCDGHANGWERVFNWLGDHLGRKASPAPEVRHFLCRLLPPRPSFIQDMTPEEGAVMQAHGAYWRQKLTEGVAVLFGPVADPKGAWGVGIVRAKDEAAVRAFEAADPVVTSGRGFRYEILPMLTAVY